MKSFCNDVIEPYSTYCDESFIRSVLSKLNIKKGDAIGRSLIKSQIPKLIWQTAKTLPHESSHRLINTWVRKNPSHRWLFMDDERCDRFIRDNFTPDFYAMYAALPVGVMKADVWRAAILYAYGGVYVDIDCECIVPLDQWVGDYSLIVAVETTDGELSNFAFAVKSRHPAILSVLNRFMELYDSDDFMGKHTAKPIQDFGQLGFSNGILRYYNIDNYADMRRGGISDHYNTVQSVVDDKAKFFTYQDRRIINGVGDNSFIQHFVASQNWNNYESWRTLEREIKQMKPVKFITTFSEVGYDLYGKTWIDTFRKYVESGVDADIYVDFPMPDAPNINVIDYQRAVPNHQQWIEQFNETFPGTPYNKSMGVRFSYKAFVMMHALRHNRDCYIVWLDGDCVFKHHPSFSDVSDVLEGKAIAVQRERNGGNDHCESGIVIMDPDHPDMPTFLSRFVTNYEIDNITKMDQPFDGFVIYRSLAGMDYVDLNDTYGKDGIQGDFSTTFLHPEINKRFQHNIGPGGKASYDTWSVHSTTDDVFRLISHCIEPPAERIEDIRARLLNLRKNII